MSDYEIRFGGIGRLYGVHGLEVLREASVCVVGVGGVGSWVAEALARSGVGCVMLVDMDDVCVTNTNRQIHALEGTVGRAKVQVMAERMRRIAPECRVEVLEDFFQAETVEEVLGREWSCVVDAIDHRGNKALLIAECVRRGLPIVTVGGAGGRRDPLSVRKADLTRATHDGLLSRIRKELRQKYGFSRDVKKAWGVPCVYSTEAIVYPTAEGEVCDVRDPSTSLKLDCASGFGTASFVTGTFGFAAAALALEEVLGRKK